MLGNPICLIITNRHIIFNSTNLSCDKKFRNFIGSSRAVRKISDRLCLEYGLSIVKKPKRKGKHYGKWLDENGKLTLTHSDIMRINIYDALQEKPSDFEDFLKKMKRRGYTVKRGKHIALRNSDMKKNIRIKSLGEEYSETYIRDVIAGKETLEKPKQKKETKELSTEEDESINLLIDVDKALQEKGAGYQNWAKKFNLKQMAKTINYLTENDLMDYDNLKAKASGISSELDSITAELREKEAKLKEIQEIQSNIVNYSKTKEIYNAYHKSGYSKKFKEEHHGDILLHETSRNFFKKEGFTTFPKMAELREEYAKTKAEKNKLYSQYYALKDENKDILNAKANIEVILDIKKEEEKDNNERKARS